MRVLVLGASGMIGNAMFRVIGERADWEVFGAARSTRLAHFFSPALAARLITGIDVENRDALIRLYGGVKPDLVVNCIGLTKHHAEANTPLLATSVNALLPHRLADLCSVGGARLIHVSTDCVFSGVKGYYAEGDPADATDFYGKTKFIGEVSAPHTVTLRTSTIGHELQSAYGLLEWFLAQNDRCKGFGRAIFSGLPSVVFAQVVRDIVIPRPELSGIFHVGAEPISKYELLTLIARVYGKSIAIENDESFVMDRSMNVQRLRDATGYVAPAWPELITRMHDYRSIKK